MCTAATYKTKDFYFGRTLDYECSYGEQIVITPRNYAFNFRHVGDMKNHVVLAITTWQTRKAARQNPIDTLKTE